MRTINSSEERFSKGMYLDKLLTEIILLNDWITLNIDELKKICNRITRGADSEDLLQLSVEQFLSNKKVSTVPDGEKLFFFARIVRNNYNSNSSPYYHQYKKFKFIEIENVDIEYLEDREPLISMEWVKGELNKLEWYYKRLMELYIEEGCSITKLSKRTEIPINSVSRDINKVRKILIKERNKILK
jgi:DNA-directed RNA polymerase specialized sigma24 family protein